MNKGYKDNVIEKIPIEIYAMISPPFFSCISC